VWWKDLYPQTNFPRLHKEKMNKLIGLGLELNLLLCRGFHSPSCENDKPGIILGRSVYVKKGFLNWTQTSQGESK